MHDPCAGRPPTKNTTVEPTTSITAGTSRNSCSDEEHNCRANQAEEKAHREDRPSDRLTRCRPCKPRQLLLRQTNRNTDHLPRTSQSVQVFLPAAASDKSRQSILNMNYLTYVFGPQHGDLKTLKEHRNQSVKCVLHLYTYDNFLPKIL